MSRLVGKEFDDFLDRLQNVSEKSSPFERREHLIAMANLSERKLFNWTASRLESDPVLSINDPSDIELLTENVEAEADRYDAWIRLLALKENALGFLKLFLDLPEKGVGYLWYLKPEMAHLGKYLPIEFSPFEPSVKSQFSVDAHFTLPGIEPIELPGFTYEMTIVLHMLEGIEPWRIKKCPGCGRYFVQTSMRERLFHDRSCANRHKSRINWAAKKTEDGGK